MPALPATGSACWGTLPMTVRQSGLPWGLWLLVMAYGASQACAFLPQPPRASIGGLR
jgi:hypothetical protein